MEMKELVPWIKVQHRIAEEKAKTHLLPEQALYHARAKAFEDVLKRIAYRQASLSEGDSGEETIIKKCEECEDTGSCFLKRNSITPLMGCVVSKPEPLGRSEEVERSEGS